MDNESTDTGGAPKRRRDVKGGLLFGVIGLLLLYLGTQDARLLVSGRTITGTIVGFDKATGQRSRGDRFNTYDVRYAYRYEGKRYEGSFTKKSFNTSEISPGRQISVRVLPSSPGVCSPADQLNPLYVPLKMGGGLALILIGLTRFKRKQCV